MRWTTSAGQSKKKKAFLFAEIKDVVKDPPLRAPDWLLLLKLTQVEAGLC